MKRYSILLALLVLFALVTSTSAQVIITDDTTSTADASSVLESKSTTKGFLAPRMTTAQRNAISSPADGLLVYDTDVNSFYVYNGTVWVTTSSSWLGSTTRIKLLPKDFTGTLVGTGKGSETITAVYSDSSDANNYGMETLGGDNGYLVAFVTIPTGYKATTVIVYGSNTDADYYIWKSDITSSDDLTSILGGDSQPVKVGTEIDFTDVASTDTNYLIIAVKFPKKEKDQLWGGYVTIEPI